MEEGLMHEFGKEESVRDRDPCKRQHRDTEEPEVGM